MRGGTVHLIQDARRHCAPDTQRAWEHSAWWCLNACMFVRVHKRTNRCKLYVHIDSKHTHSEPYGRTCMYVVFKKSCMRTRTYITRAHSHTYIHCTAPSWRGELDHMIAEVRAGSSSLGTAPHGTEAFYDFRAASIRPGAPNHGTSPFHLCVNKVISSQTAHKAPHT